MLRYRRVVAWVVLFGLTQLASLGAAPGRAAADCIPRAGKPCVSEGKDARERYVAVEVEGRLLNLYPAAYEEGVYVMGPMRAVLEALGAEVTWNEREQSETAVLGQHSVKVWMGSRTYLVGGVKKQLPIAPRLVNDVVVAPLRWISEALKADVTWDEAARTERIKLAELPWVIRPVNLKLNDQKVDLNPGAFEENEYVMGPMRGVMEALGAKVTFNETEGSMTATANGRSIKVFKGSKRALASGASWDLPMRPRMIRGQLYVPLRRVAQALGATVVWDGLTRLETITLKLQPDNYQDPLVVNGPADPVSEGDMRVIETAWELEKGKLYNLSDADARSQVASDVAPELVELVVEEFPERAAELAGKAVKVAVWLDIIGELLLERPEPVKALYKRVVVERQAQVYEGGRWRTLVVSQALRHVVVIPAETALQVLPNGHVTGAQFQVATVDFPPPAHFDKAVLLDQAIKRHRWDYPFICESWFNTHGCFNSERFTAQRVITSWLK